MRPWVGLVLTLLPCQERRQEPEDSVKAWLIYNLSTETAVRWPAGAFADAEAPFVLGLLSPSDELHAELAAIAEKPENYKAQKRKIKLLRADDPEKLKDCHLVFVSAKARGHAEAVIKMARNRPLITVSETDDFCASGGIFNFHKTKDSRIKIQANPDAAANTGLSLSANFLTLTTIVKGKTP